MMRELRVVTEPEEHKASIAGNSPYLIVSASCEVWDIITGKRTLLLIGHE